MATAAAAYEDPEEQYPVGIMDPVVEIQHLAYATTWMDQKQASMIIKTGIDSTRW